MTNICYEYFGAIHNIKKQQKHKMSAELLLKMQSECTLPCKEYIYWWSRKASRMPYTRFKFKQCIDNCVKKTMQQERNWIISEKNL